MESKSTKEGTRIKKVRVVAKGFEQSSRDHIGFEWRIEDKDCPSNKDTKETSKNKPLLGKSNVPIRATLQPPQQLRKLRTRMQINNRKTKKPNG